MAWLGAGTRTGTNLDTIEWQPNTLWSGFQLVPAMTNGDCMMYVVCASTKVASHFIANIDTALGTANPGMSVRYWQPTDSWIAYHNVAGTTGSVTASAASYTASTKILLGVRVSGTALSISVNGAVTTGGTATLFTASRAVLNLENSANLVSVYDAYSTTGYSETLAVRLEGFLAAKHGITLANGHPYRLSPPTLEWIPTDDSGLTIWYDFADSSTITVTGAGISDLKNKKNPATYNLTQSTDGDRPSWDGSKATGRGSGVGLNYTGTVSFTNAAYAAHIVARFPTPNANIQRIMSGVDGGSFSQHFISSNSNSTTMSYRASNSSGSPSNLSIAYSSNNDTLLSFQFDGATNKKAFVMGVNALDDSINNGPITLNNLRILNANTTASINDFLVTSSTDTATRQRLEGYLAWKRGLQSSLPSGHPYRTKKPIYQEWTPADDASCIIWYDFADASTITITGAGISQLTNKVAGGTFTLTQSTDASRPSWNGSTATGRNTSDGAGGLWITTTVNWTNAAYLQISTGAYSGFNGVSAREIRVSDGASISYHHISPEVASNNIIGRWNNVSGAAGESYIESSYTPETALAIRARTFSGGASGTATAYRNGTQTYTATNANINPVVGSAMGLLARATNITMGDFIVTSATSTAIRQKYEGWLAWKRGLASSLPSDHPYKSRPPLTTD